MQDEKQREEYKIFCDNVKKWTVHDYFTPNIKAEVILDMLLTPYIAPILNQYFEKKTVVYVTKEFPIGIRWSKGKAILSEDNKSNKVDYVCMDEDTLYLVELKTTDESFSERQDSCYRKLLEETQKYGSGTYLSGVLKKILGRTKDTLFCDILKRYRGNYDTMDYDAVLHQMKKDNIKGKYKYRLTAKEIVQCGEEAFCQCKKIKIVYLTPTIKKEEEEQIKYITLVDEEDSASLNKKFKDCLDSFTAEILKELYI